MSEENVNGENECIDFFGHDLDEEAQYDDSGELSISSTSTIDKLVNKEDVLDFCSNSKKIKAVTLHHTWKPDSTQYNGRSTVLGIKRYHMQNVGARDIMANFYTSPVDGYIGWTARSLNVKNGAHAYISRNWNDVSQDIKNRTNYNKQWPNTYTIGIETIANMDKEDPTTNKSMKNSIKLMAILFEHYNLDVDKDLYFHRDFAYKSCCGSLVSKSWVKEEVKKQMGNGTECKDLPAKNYQKEALQWAKDTGLLIGDNEGNQMPQCSITRGDMIVVLKRFKEMFIDKE